MTRPWTEIVNRLRDPLDVGVWALLEATYAARVKREVGGKLRLNVNDTRHRCVEQGYQAVVERLKARQASQEGLSFNERVNGHDPIFAMLVKATERQTQKCLHYFRNRLERVRHELWAILGSARWVDSGAGARGLLDRLSRLVRQHIPAHRHERFWAEYERYLGLEVTRRELVDAFANLSDQTEISLDRNEGDDEGPMALEGSSPTDPAKIVADPPLPDLFEPLVDGDLPPDEWLKRVIRHWADDGWFTFLREAQLDANDQLVFLLVYQLELSHEDAARILQCTVSAINSRAYRSLRKVRQLAATYSGEALRRRLRLFHRPGAGEG